MREVLEEGANPENFNWIVRQIVRAHLVPCNVHPSRWLG